MRVLGLRNGYQKRAFGFDHIVTLRTLLLRHKDPFDCMLTVQARTEGLPLLTSDANILAYGRDVIET